MARWSARRRVGTSDGSRDASGGAGRAAAALCLLLALACGGGAKKADSGDGTPPPGPVPTVCIPAAASPSVVNVRDAPYGARGDGAADDTAAIQRAVDAVGGTGGTVLVPDGTYLVNAVAQSSMGIRLRSSMTFRMSPGAVLKAIPNGSDSYAILAINRVSSVNVVGGTLQGERGAHQSSGGEGGVGLLITGAQHVVVEGTVSRDCWGDGFYVSGASSDVTLCNVVSDHNLRQGLSITSVSGMAVRNSTFKNTTGTEPEAGIDVEPNSGDSISQVLITGCTLTNNAGGGFQCGTPFSGSATATGIVFDQNTVNGNGASPVGGKYRQAIKVTVFDGVQITNNQVLDNIGQGICLTDNATRTLVKGNAVKGTQLVSGDEYWTGAGILVSACAGSTITQNTVTNNAGRGIWQIVADATVTISNNTESGNRAP